MEGEKEGGREEGTEGGVNRWMGKCAKGGRKGRPRENVGETKPTRDHFIASELSSIKACF